MFTHKIVSIINIDLLVSDIKLNEFDAVIFIGGPGCLKNLDNENSYKVIRQTTFYLYNSYSSTLLSVKLFMT